MSNKDGNNCYAMYVIWWSTRATEPNRIEMESANEIEIEEKNNNNSIEWMKVSARFRNVSEKILIKFQLNLLKLYVLANVSVRFCTNSLLWSDRVCGSIDQLRFAPNGYGRHTEQKKNVDVGSFVSKCQEAQSHREHETDMCMCCGLCVIISHLLGYWISNK